MAGKWKEDSLTIEDKLKAALVPESEQPYPIPENWVWTYLLSGSAECLDQFRKPINAEERALRQGTIPYYGATGQVGWIDDYLTDEELVLLGEDGAPFLERGKSKAYRIEGKAWVNNHAHILRSFYGTHGNIFLLHYLNQFDYTSFVSGTTRLKLTQAAMRRMPVPLSPLSEQQRIAEKLDSLLGKIKEAKALLDEIPEILQNFRQSVLAAACSGRLTEDWRRENPEKKSSLVAGRQTHKGHLFEMPTTWAMVTVKDMSTSIEYGYTASANKSPVGPRLLRITDIQDGKVNWEDVPYCEIDEKRKRKFLLAPGDIVFARTGATTGKSFLIEACPAAVFASYLIRIKPGSEMIPQFMYFFFQSEFYWQQIYENLSGIAQPNCNATKLSSVNIPLPPFSEQAEIVRNIESLFSKAADFEAQYKEAMDLIDALPEIILSKAFRGELVPQDPNDEPAIKLLEKVLKEKESVKVSIDVIAVGRPEIMIKKDDGGSQKRSLLAVLKETKDHLTSEELFRKAGYNFDDLDDVEAFYAELSKEVREKRIKELRLPSSKAVTLERAI